MYVCVYMHKSIEVCMGSLVNRMKWAFLAVGFFCYEYLDLIYSTQLYLEFSGPNIVLGFSGPISIFGDIGIYNYYILVIISI